ncbi:MAG: hypothetical protein IKO72_15530 [Kiritimatiellae bacterium]|nr:hypothetical protein [Kiritimatiellia bacterium]
MVKYKWCSYVFYGALMLIGLGIIMGSLFPAGRDPFVPTSSAIAMKGQWLHQAIVQNRIRHEAGEVWCDPNTCSNSMEFVRGVFNLPETKEWREHGTHMGIDPLWNVAIDVPDDCGDTSIPILISSNFNPKFLECHFDEGAILPIGRDAGAQDMSLADKGIVVVRRGGAAQVLKAKHCTRKAILGDSVKHKCRITFLTPQGRITVDI